MILITEDVFTVGNDTYIDSVAPVGQYGVVFEDDCTTGYFYALLLQPEMQILDALHIYNVANVTDKHKPCTVKILWAEDGLVACLVINDYCHAMFDFSIRAGYCRTAFPRVHTEWARINDRTLTDEMVKAAWVK